jgi:hypothetical protein
MGQGCCNISKNLNDLHELSTGHWDIEDMKKHYTKKKKLIIFNNKTLKTKNKIDIDMHLTEKLEPVECPQYYQNQEHTPDDTFIDPLFKPQEKSIINVDKSKDIAKDILPEEIDAIRGFKWIRPHEIFRTYNYYLYKGIEPNDIKQGALGNCYFLASISAISEFRERIESILVENERTENGQYGVKLYIQGVPTIIIVDDQLPCYANNGRQAFTHCNGSDNEIWVALIEKAWAKLNGSYAMTIAGLPSEGLSAMTYAPTVTYVHQKYKNEQIWDILLESERLDYIICTCTKGSEGLDKVGLVPGHAYTIISVYEINTLKLIKIRNPWGQFEWKGDYGDNSKLWTPELKKKVAYENTDDGIFYMNLEDFLTYFPYSFICKFERDFVYNYKKFVQTPDETIVACKLYVPKTTKIMINLHQKYSRITHDIPGYKENMSRMIICKYDKTKTRCYEYLSSHASTNEKIHCEFNRLEPGEYHIFCHVNWPFQNYENSYVISTYAEYPIEIESLNKTIIPEDFLHMIFYNYLDKHEQNKKLKENLNLQISCKDNDLGFYMMLFKNSSKNEAHTISFDVNLNKNVRLCTKHDETKVNRDTPDNKNYSLRFTIEPETDYLVLFEILNEPWYSKLDIGKVRVSTRQGVKLDPFKGAIRTHVKNLHGSELEIKGLFAKEYEDSDSFCIIFQNTLDANFKIQCVCSNLVNLKGENEKHLIYVERYDFSYIKMDKIEKGKSVDFAYTYNIKKLFI